MDTNTTTHAPYVTAAPHISVLAAHARYLLLNKVPHARLRMDVALEVKERTCTDEATLRGFISCY